MCEKRGTAELACDKPATPTTLLQMTRENLITAQKEDESLTKYLDMAISPGRDKIKDVLYFIENCILMRRWSWDVSSGGT